MTTFVVHVENKPGVLTRVASLFRRRAYNIESLTVGHTETPGISRMTIVVDTHEEGAHHVEAHLAVCCACRGEAIPDQGARRDACRDGGLLRLAADHPAAHLRPPGGAGGAVRGLAADSGAMGAG